MGTIDRYSDEAYCYPHLMALVEMNANRRPKPLVTFFPNFAVPVPDVTKTRTHSERIARVSTFEQAEKRIQALPTENTLSGFRHSSSTLEDASKPKSSKIRNWSIFVIAILLIGGFVYWNESEQARKAAVEVLQTRNNLASECFLIKGEDEAVKSGGVGDPAREKAVLEFYDRVIKSSCVEWGDGSLSANPFFGVTASSNYWKVLENSFRYSLERWNGIEPFYLRCADGWDSPSIGKRGACSHHGGVTSGFNEFKGWDLSNHVRSGETLYPAIAELEEAANR